MSDANRTHGLGVYESHAIGRAPVFWLLGLLAGAAVLLAFGGDSARALFRYERLAILEAGEYWRLVTGHLVHGSTTHLALNLAGLLLIAALFPRHFALFEWFAVLIGSAVAIDLGFVLNEPQLDWYVGLSGVLHGCLAAGAIAWWRYETRGLALALTAILSAKLAWEQWSGALPFSGDMLVIVDAHLYGAIGGACVALVLCLSKARWSAGPRSI